MKKLLFSLLIVLTVLLSACGPASTGTPTSSTDNDLSIATQLAVGTLKLAESGQDITADQAEELSLYWQVYKELSQSDTAAQAEMDGLVAQIQETMTDAQMQAIADMRLTQQDVLTAMQGLTVVSSATSDSTVSAPSGEDLPTGGSPSDGGGAPPDNGGIALELNSAVPPADQVQGTQAGASLVVNTVVPSTLVVAVIESLQQKIAA